MVARLACPVPKPMTKLVRFQRLNSNMHYTMPIFLRLSRRYSVRSGFSSAVALLLACLSVGIVSAEQAEGFDALAAQLESAAPEEQFNIVERIADTGDPRAVPTLIQAMERDMRVRTGIAMGIIPVLGYLADDRAVPILIKSLNYRSDDWLGREASAVALGEIGGTAAVPALINAAWMADTRPHAIQALAKIADPRAVEVLISALDREEEREVRQAALEGLIHIGAEAVPALSAKLADWSQEYPAVEERALAAKALGEIGLPSARQALIKALDDPSEVIRSSAGRALSHESGKGG